MNLTEILSDKGAHSDLVGPTIAKIARMEFQVRGARTNHRLMGSSLNTEQPTLGQQQKKAYAQTIEEQAQWARKQGLCWLPRAVEPPQADQQGKGQACKKNIPLHSSFFDQVFVQLVDGTVQWGRV